MSDEMKTQQLFNSIKRGSVGTISNLLSEGADVNAKNGSEQNTLLHEAVLARHIELVKFLIDSDADVNIRNKNGDTPLQEVLNDEDNITQSNLIRILVEAGADVNTRRQNGDQAKGMTALHAAAMLGDYNLAHFLINLGADVNARDHTQDGWTPMHFAARYVNSDDPTIFQVLLSAGADVNAKDGSSGQMPIHVMIENREYQDTNCPVINIIKVFVKYGADFDAIYEGLKPIDYAIICKYTRMVEAMVECCGADVNGIFQANFHSISIGKPYLFAACEKRDLPTVRFLVKNGANIHTLVTGNVSILQFILDCEIDIYSQLEEQEGREDDDDDSSDDDYEPDESNSKLMNVLRYLLKQNPDVNNITSTNRNVLNHPKHDLPDCYWKAILEHLAKLQAYERPIHPSLLETISETREYKNYFEKCQKELEIMKNTKLDSKCWVNYLNILMDDKSKLIQYAGNENLGNHFLDSRKKDFLKNFKSKVHYAGKFPIYGNRVHEKISKATTNRHFWDEAALKLSDILPIDVDSTHRVVINILSFLSTEELVKVSLC